MNIFRFCKNINRESKLNNHVNHSEISKNIGINADNQNEKIYKDYFEAIKLDPQNGDLYVELSKAYWSQKKYDLAIKYLDVAFELEPQKHYFFYFLRHLIFWELGNLEKSLEDIKQAVNLAPPEYMYHKHLAKVYVELGQRENAILALKKEIEENPKNRHAYWDNAVFYERIGQFQEALEYITMAIEVEPAILYSYHRRAKIYAKMGQFDNALKDCNVCIQIEPKEWTHYRVRSEVYKAKGDTRAAEADYHTSMDLNPCINR
ncbi:tetratricopeptide repeat protein [Bacillus sp. T3]|uniref:tetratricopeptide repeat protein n=1 Tax=Bacillus sp. T3 TaxID=467262 RepID=UPI0029816C1F|nr:tetratricopeptide repeat protein [Bacillus sp. T3]